MKDFREQLRHIQGGQERLLQEYESLVREYESQDLLLENQTLRQQAEERQKRLAELQLRLRRLEEENGRLRTSLAEQMMDEKLNIIKVSREKLSTYFGTQSAGHMNRLAALEMETRTRIIRLFQQASAELKTEQQELAMMMQRVSAELNQRVERHREKVHAAQSQLREQVTGRLNAMAHEELDEATIQRRIKQNQIEMKIGLNWINKLGILLIILGVGAAFRYSYATWFNSYMKGSAFFLLGLLLLGGGEWLFRRQKQTFALGLLGGGISVLYGSIFYSYFLLDIISLWLGLAMSVIVSLLAVLLSLRYQSRTILGLALAGGYMPLMSYIWASSGLEGNAVYAAMVYLFLLNVAILIVSFRRRWEIIHQISFVLHTPSWLLLLSFTENVPVAILYTMLSFLMYLGITLGYPFLHKAKLKVTDIVLLALNAMISCVLVYGLFNQAGWQDYRGLLALLFCAAFWGLGKLTERTARQEKLATILFYVTSLTFAILMIPFQLGMRWLSMGWLAEAVLLIIYGGRHQLKSMVRAGWGILMLCLAAFLLVDVTIYQLLGLDEAYFELKYTFVIAGMLGVTLHYAVSQRRGEHMEFMPYEWTLIRVFKWITLINLWFYLLYEGHVNYARLVPQEWVHDDYYHALLIAGLTIGLSYILGRIQILKDAVVRYYRAGLYAVGYLICLYVLLAMPAFQWERDTHSIGEYVALIILVVVHGFTFLHVRDVLLRFMQQRYANAELYPVIMGLYLLVILTVFMLVQLRLGELGYLFSMLYLLLAIGYIAYGFRGRYIYIRRMGLGLTLLATAKLALFDMTYVSAGSKIVSYFAFGVILLGISYMYQKVSSKLGGSESEENRRRSDSEQEASTHNDV